MSIKGDRLLQKKSLTCRLLGSRLIPWLQGSYKHQVGGLSRPTLRQLAKL